MSKIAAVVKKIPSFVGNVVKQIPAVVGEAAKLQSPVLDATIVADVIAITSPFGINVGPAGPIITNALLGIGIVAAAVEKVVVELKAEKKPTARKHTAVAHSRPK